MSRTRPQSQVAPWGPLYGCLCSRRESSGQYEMMMFAAADQLPVAAQSMGANLMKIASSVFRTMMAKSNFDIFHIRGSNVRRKR